jgi:hypothetical protein
MELIAQKNPGVRIMRLSLFRGVPSLSIFWFQSGVADPGRCVRNLKAGRPSALKQIRSVFSDSLLYIATELMPKDTDKRRIAEIAFAAFEALWDHRESIQDPEDVKIFLNKTVMEACRQQNPSVDNRSAMMVTAFAEIARTMIEMEKALPKKYQRFYKMKFIMKLPDADIGDELGLDASETKRYTAEVTAFMKGVPRWGK